MSATTETTRPAFVSPLVSQSPEMLINSASAGLIVHRVGQLRYEHSAAGWEFSANVARHVNRAVSDVVTLLLYREVFGVRDRVHWLLHLRMPNDYGRLLHMADHDDQFLKLVESDDVPEEAPASWDRAFVEGSYRETVLVPQHGLGHDDADPGGTYLPPAASQTGQQADELLHSASAAVTILRTGQVRYADRNTSRAFAFEWSRRVNEALRGSATALLFEENFGQQDRIHWMIHLDSLDRYRDLEELEARDPAMQRIFAKPRVPASRGSGAWGCTFVDASITDTVLVPFAPSPAGEGA